METDFWHERWKNNQIGFHQAEINAFLLKHWDKLNIATGSEIFVPMAGKSKDILWLKEQGYQVLAIELSEDAVKAFFQENKLTFQIENTEDFIIYRSENITFYCGNYFDLNKAILQSVAAVFDRASLVALPQTMRKQYQIKMCQILPAMASVLLLTMEYQQHQMDGPPFSVNEDEVHNLFSDSFEISCLESIDSLKNYPQFVSRGLTEMVEKVFFMRPGISYI